MHNNYFRKPIFLPSGGLDYPPFVWLAPITNELSLHEYDMTPGDSNFSSKLTLLEKYIESNVNLFDMFTQDINYIWSYMMIEDIVTDGIYHISHTCYKPNCRHINNVKIDMGSLDIKYLNIYDDDVDKFFNYQSKEGLKIKLSRRRAKHNLNYGHILFSDTTKEKNEYAYQVNLFIVTQIEEILYNNIIVPKNEYIKCLKSLRLYEIDEILGLILSEENKFGIHNQLCFNCVKCNEKNILYLFNDFQESKIVSTDPIPNIINKQKELFKNIFEFARLPIMGYESYLKTPIRFIKGMGQAIQGMEFHNGSIL